MKILLLGSSGRTGRLVLKEAIQKGYQVNCLVRDAPKKINHDNLRFIEGLPNNDKDLEEAIVGCEKVIMVLNISRKSDFPWSKLKTPKKMISDSMKSIIRLANKHGIDHISTCSAWGVGETKNHIPKWFKWLINNSNIGFAYEDHERQENVLTESNIKWTIIRPVGLTNSKRKEKLIETFNNIPKPNLLISRNSVAKYLLESLNNENLVNKKVVISKA